jgi:hypothetical protein
MKKKIVNIFLLRALDVRITFQPKKWHVASIQLQGLNLKFNFGSYENYYSSANEKKPGLHL